MSLSNSEAVSVPATRRHTAHTPPLKHVGSSVWVDGDYFRTSKVIWLVPRLSYSVHLRLGCPISKNPLPMSVQHEEEMGLLREREGDFKHGLVSGQASSLAQGACCQRHKKARFQNLE